MSQPHFRVGLGHDTHRLGPDRRLVLGGVEIPHETGLVGHSDADVLLHAITDALLGACGLGDIGELFPDTDPRNRDVDSAIFLRAALKAVREAGYRPVNLDCTIHAQRPKLSPWKLIIRARLAQLLELDETRINVKAKTGERVGPVGREESMSADAVVLVEVSNPATAG
ncbi:MAG: 2-C-methyl-D-erythritol 2,4-cyclodiphosphate synthase [Planctomycetaceae bacterium]